MGWLDNLKGNVAIGIGPQGGQIASASLREKKREERKKASEEELQRIEAIGLRALDLGLGGIATALTGQSSGDPELDQIAQSFKAQMDLRVKEGAYTQEEANKGLRYALSLHKLVFEPIRRVAEESIQSGLTGIERGRQISGEQGNPLWQMSGTALSKQLGGLPVGKAAERVSQYYGGNPQVFSQLPFNEPTYGLATSPSSKGTFYQQDPAAWEEQQRKLQKIKKEYRTPPKTPAQIETEAAAGASGRAKGTPTPQPRYQETWIYNKDGTMRHPARYNPLTGTKEPLTINGKANWQKVPQGQLGQALGRVEETLRKQSGGPAGVQTETLPQGLDEQTIQFNMKKYGKTREEVISKYKEKYGLK